MKQYITKPVIIKAIQYDGFNKKVIESILGKQVCEYYDLYTDKFYLVIDKEKMYNGDYIIKDKDGYRIITEKEFNDKYVEYIDDRAVDSNPKHNIVINCNN